MAILAKSGPTMAQKGQFSANKLQNESGAKKHSGPDWLELERYTARRICEATHTFSTTR